MMLNDIPITIHPSIDMQIQFKHTVLALMMAGAAFFASCESKTEIPTMQIMVTKGAIVLNSGDVYNTIDGSITYIDFTTEQAQQNVFKYANGMSLGGSPDDVIVYDDKIYVAGSDENAVFVLNAKNFKLIQTISTTEQMGEPEGNCPKRLCAYDGKVYFSTRGGYVGVIDTQTLSIVNKYQVGPSPEGIAVGMTGETPFLYVANSDEGLGQGSISVVNLLSGSASEWTNDRIAYPMDLFLANDGMYVLDGGVLDGNMEMENTGIYRAALDGSNVTKVAKDARVMSAVGYNILYYHKSKDGDSGYSVLDTRGGHTSDFSFQGDASSPIAQPGAMAIDPNTGYILLASSPEGYDVDTPCHVNLYTGDGQFVKSYPAGVCPKRIVFLYRSYDD